MAKVSRRIIVVIILLVIGVNVWYLSKRQSSFDPALSSEEAQSVPDTNKPPKFQSPQDSTLRTGTSPKVEDSPKVEAESPKKDQTKGSGASSGANSRPDSVHDSSPVSSEEKIGHEVQHTKEYDAGMASIKSTLDKISEIQPGVNPLKKFVRDIKSDTGLMESNEFPPTTYILSQYLRVSDADVEKLKTSHAQMMDVLPDKVVSNAFAGRGIVMTGGGKYFPMILTALRWLREVDPTTPVEVYMKDKFEYEANICDGLFPKLNAECRVIRDIYGESLSNKLDTEYALKPLAILASKFDDIYFMDADSYPMNSVNKYFDWDEYKKTGLILNADYWPRYISPFFYDIVGIKLGARARGNHNSDALLQSDRENAIPGKSTESGQVFIRKSTHIKSLLLAMYYNLFGPDIYFTLLMQNGHGEGDKDTYAAAAIICGESYYQTQRRPVTLGTRYGGQNFKGFAMVQPDPMVDYERYEEGKDTTEKFFALHANSLKSNPKYLLQGYTEPIRGAPPLQQGRFFGDMSNIRKEIIEDVDVEQRLFRIMSEVACEWAVKENYVPRDWEDQDPVRFCNILKKHVEWLKTHPDTAFPESARYWIDEVK